ncbi:MAG TPA: FHA domain-containing protein [Desulfobacterales bacterium]|jgi:pSer/pThr/pTyr-binding forkhead associated (FHA) protein|nr:FHA domain-containing protein [Desulfobacterales bacterium]
MAVLTLQFNGRELESFPIGVGDSFLIGRHPINDIVIDNLAVSFQHAKIESIGGDFLLIDLKSDNGSFVNDQRIKAHWLSDGDAISIGKHILHFSAPKGGVSEPLPPSVIQTMQIDTAKFRSQPKSSVSASKAGAETGPEGRAAGRAVARGLLTVLSGGRQDLVLGEAPVRIGKSPSADIVVRGFGVGMTAAVVNRLEDGWYISYVGGMARVRVNRQPLKTSVKLNRLDVIRLRRTAIQFLTPAGA